MRNRAAALLFSAACMTGRVSRPQEPVQPFAQAVEQALPVADQMVEGQVLFSFVPRMEGQPSWEIRLGKDRNGTYRELPPTAKSQAPGQPLHVSDAVWKRVQAAVPAVRRRHCETKQKGIAQTGAKNFAVSDGASTASCTFNYSDDEGLNDAASAFLALAETLDEGAKLQRDHRFNKLALDADMDVLVGEVEAGRALEPQNIAPVLQSLIDDDHVIDRVRRKAARLLQMAADKPR